ncbi:tyrosine-type recombinase/integrase [Corynebacterium sp. SCR221107]|uniref:tyrosine-type recombinase/integrase n=1 Tax=Corynebacterium sp. SCR221107 TaxID=3017361 RepID=UPI0022EC2E8A|nr:tyrosine-type recombinase/integrase [Corynebacterium sp. SCR221107]WBT10095.1 tyrosine-type recombinase/integrase [Corynebacterium sp. SCR221107]
MQGKLADDRVFQSLEGKPLDPANFSYRVYRPLIKSLNKEQGYPLVTIHDLRHTAASLAVSSGANIKSLQRMLGHKSAALTLDVYADLFEEDLSDVALKMDALIQSSLKCTESVPGNEETPS